MTLRRNHIRRREVYLLVILLLLPLLTDSRLVHHVLVIAGTYAIASLGLSLFMGYAGQISLGHAAFFGIGAYSMAILTLRYGLPPLLALAMGGLLSGLTAWIIGTPILKLREYFLALVTIGLVRIFQVFTTEPAHFTGGVAGLYNIPCFSLLGFAFDTTLKRMYLVWGILYLLFWYARNLVNSHFGRASVAVAASEDTALTCAIDPAALKRNFFVISAVYAAIGGGLFACAISSVNPATFGLEMSVTFVMAVIIGGMGSLGGAVIGAVVLAWATHFLGGFQQFSLPAYGLLLILLLIFLPEGLFRGIGARWFDLIRTWADDNWRREVDR